MRSRWSWRSGGTPAVGSAFLQIRWYRVGKLAQDAVLKFGLLPVLLAARGLRGLRALPLLRRLIGVWAGVAVALALVAVVTPFPLRAEYFAVPAVAIVAGLGAERLGREGHSRARPGLLDRDLRPSGRDRRRVHDGPL